MQAVSSEFTVVRLSFQARYFIGDLVFPPWEAEAIQAKQLAHEEATKEPVETLPCSGLHGDFLVHVSAFVLLT